MNFDLTPEDDHLKKKAADGTRIGPGQPASKEENPWKGRFDRRKSARELSVDFPAEDNENGGNNQEAKD